MKTIFFKSLPIIAVLFFALGCSFVNQVKKGIDKMQTPHVVTGKDGKSQLTVPGSWKEQTRLNEEASLQVGNPFAEQYAIIITESKEDFTEEMTLEDFTSLIRQNADEAITNAIISENKSLSINGYPAKQFEVSGSIDNIKAKWIYTLIDAPENYHQIMAWTLASRYEENKPVLLEVVNSFKEIGAATAKINSKKP